jgi:hypothetical protein
MALATALLVRATRLGAHRSEEDVIIPAIGSRVTRPTRAPIGPLRPVPGGDA